MGTASTFTVIDEALYNKSLDASGASGSLIANLSATWLFPAASTQTLGRPWEDNDGLDRDP
jgi:hypothetical protein